MASVKGFFRDERCQSGGCSNHEENEATLRVIQLSAIGALDIIDHITSVNTPEYEGEDLHLRKELSVPALPHSPIGTSGLQAICSIILSRSTSND